MLPAEDHRKRPRQRRPPRILRSLPDEHLLTTSELLERIPLDRLTIRKMVLEGRFPPPIAITRSRIAWKWSSVLAWLAEREADPIEQRKYFNRDVA
jgi:predicted DNA-binding transcriptional regulator AlpA